MQPSGHSKFGNKIKGRINSRIISNEVNILHPLDMQLLSTPVQTFRKGFTQSESDFDISSSSFSLKRGKSVKFNDTPSEKPAKQSNIKNPVSILKNSFIQKSESSVLSSSRNLNNSFYSVANTQRSKLSASDSVVQDQRLVQVQKKKFNLSFQNHVLSKKKYFDDLFPQGSSSIYLKRNATQYGDIKWVRIQDIYRGSRLGIYNCDKQKRNTILNGVVPIQYMVTCFNALDGSPRCLERIFQDQKVNEVGMYLLRIFVNGIWKYVVVDDFIPTVTINGKQVPLFLDISPNKPFVNIWPFLLQKAYAKLYSSYQSLTRGVIQDFMNQLTGASVQTLLLRSSSSVFDLRKHFSNPQYIIILGKQTPSSTEYYPSDNGKCEGFVPSFMEQQIIRIQSKEYEVFEIVQQFSEAIVAKVDECHYSIGCTIHQTKDSKISIRSFVIDSSTVCDISLIQKDTKYFCNNGYQYSWVRLIIAMKEKEGIRYVTGAFNNQKSIHLESVLDPGEYYVVVIADWSHMVHNVCLSYNGTSPISFQRKTGKEVPNIMEQICADIAQRFGVFKQLSTNLCSYRYVDQKLGLLIEDINNENSSREVALIKSYFQVLAEFSLQRQIQCFDSEFIASKFVMSKRIKPKDHYTLVLRLKGRKSFKFLDHFTFDQ